MGKENITELIIITSLSSLSPLSSSSAAASFILFLYFFVSSFLHPQLIQFFFILLSSFFLWYISFAFSYFLFISVVFTHTFSHPLSRRHEATYKNTAIPFPFCFPFSLFFVFLCSLFSFSLVSYISFFFLHSSSVFEIPYCFYVSFSSSFTSLSSFPTPSSGQAGGRIFFKNVERTESEERI